MKPIVLRRNHTILATGASYTRIFDVKVYFNLDQGEVKLAPIFGQDMKGYQNRRYVYQVVNPKHAVLHVFGSATGGSGPTPEQLRKQGPWPCLYFSPECNASDISKFLKPPGADLINEVFVDVLEKVPGRFCYTPPAERPEWALPIFPSLKETLDFIEEKLPPAYIYDRVRSGIMPPTKQGGLRFLSWPSVVTLVRCRNYDYQVASRLHVRGNEENSHEIIFSASVEIAEAESGYIFVHSPRKVNFTVRHPQHTIVTGWFLGLVVIYHRRKG